MFESLGIRVESLGFRVWGIGHFGGAQVSHRRWIDFLKGFRS